MRARHWFGTSARARSYDEWKRAAVVRDEATGKARWKQVDRTRLYDHATVRTRLEQLRRLRAAHDDIGLMGMLDEGVHGNVAGMGRAELYSRAEFGTKALIAEYIEAVCEALHHLAQCPDSAIAGEEKREFFERARVCFGRSALLLSGGGVYGNFHVGVVKVLIEQDLLPTVISGSSAGALIAAIVGTYTREELGRVLDERQLLVETRREASLLRQGFRGLLPQFDLQAVIRHVERLVPDLTLAEAYERTGIRINISVSPARLHQMPRLLNAATTPHVLVRSAVLASCAVPGVFPPAMLVARNRAGEPQPYMPEQRWYDGSMNEDVPERRLSRLYGVNHCIVSQVNPFALALSRHQGNRSVLVAPLLQFWHHAGLGIARAWQDVAGRHGRRWPRLNFAINGLVSVLAQNYRGDITILPELGMVKVWRGMKAPTEQELRELIAAGERATWPEVEMIRDCTRIGRTLDAILAGCWEPARSTR
jgi:TAG lipase/steryl ester hydrolase/phospholipase A2/LPA acyltransferase